MLTIIKSSFLDYKLTILRNKNTSNSLFRQTMNETSYLIAAEVLKNLKYKNKTIETPVKKAIGKDLSKSVIIVPILRAGLGLVEGFVKFLPNVEKGHIGLYRDEQTYKPVEYLFKLPKVKDKIIIVLDPMLATGNSSVAAINLVKRAGVSIDFTIGSDNEAAGAQGADYVAKVLGGEASGPVLVIEGLSGNITGQKRARGFANRIKMIAPGLKVVASLPGDWDRMKAANITNDILTRFPDLKAIFAANDGMALGAVESAYSAGKGKDIVIVGVDGNSDAVKSIKAGRLNASVAQLPYLVGKRAVIGATVALHGLKLEKFQFVDTLVLTKDVIEKNTHRLMKYVK